MTRNQIIIANAFKLPGLMTSSLSRMLSEDMAAAARKGGIDENGQAYGKQYPRLPHNRPETGGKPMGKAAEIIAALIEAGRPMKRSEIAEATGLPADNFKDVLTALKRQGIIAADDLGRNVFQYRYLGAEKDSRKVREWATQ